MVNPYGSEEGGGGGASFLVSDAREALVKAVMLQLLTHINGFLGHGGGGVSFLPMKIQNSMMIEPIRPAKAP